MAEIIAIANNKGGVGKTTTVLAIGRAWAAKGKKLLLVDLDSQANLTSTLLSEDYEAERTIADAFIEKKNIPVENIEENIDLVPSGLSLSNFDSITARFNSREFLLADLLAPVKNNYDFIILDCPPALGLITYNAMVAANHLLMVATSDRYSYDGMMMIAQIYNDVRESVRLNPKLSLDGVIITKYRKNKISEMWLNKIRGEVGEIFVNPVIREATKIQQATTFRKSFYEYDPDGTATTDYRQISEEIYRRVTANQQ
ncbi:MAG: AAA family ATPase [Bacteroidales bacterium]|nr:AAA family ATPase [Bacteroidales bacterium]